ARRLPGGLRGAGAAPAAGGVRGGPPGDRRPGRRGRRTAVGVDRPLRQPRGGRTARGSAPHRLAGRTPGGPRRPYSFWSPVLLRVMFFLRRGAPVTRPEPQAHS